MSCGGTGDVRSSLLSLYGVQVVCAPHCCLSVGCRWCVLLTVLCGVQVVCAPHCVVWGTGGVCSSLSCVGYRWCVLLTVLCGVQVVCAPHCLVWGAGGVCSSLSCVGCRWCALLTVCPCCLQRMILSTWTPTIPKQLSGGWTMGRDLMCRWDERWCVSGTVC